LGGDGTWGRDDVILFDGGDGDSIRRVPAVGGAPSAATMIARSELEVGNYWPRFLSDGRHYLYVASRTGPEGAALRLGSLDSKETKVLTVGDYSRVEYVLPGYLLFVRDRVLMAQALDTRRQRLAGEPFPVVGDVNTAGDDADFSASENGVLAFREFIAGAERLVWVDRVGRELGTIAEFANPFILSLSPDASRIAVTQNGDIWVIERSRGVTARLTFDPAFDYSPVWSPDGNNLLFASNRGGTAGLYQKPSSGAGEDELLIKPSLPLNPSDYSSDGRYIAGLHTGKGTSSDIWVLPTFGDRRPMPFIRTPSDEREARFSPDSRWIAYSSDESGRREVYVQGFLAPGGQWQISSQGGRDPQWRRDGKEIFFLSTEGKMMCAEVSTVPTFQVGAPKVLFQATPPYDGQVGRNYGVSGDGQHFVVRKRAAVPPPITVVLHWNADLRR
jgi:hypothetical protein